MEREVEGDLLLGDMGQVRICLHYPSFSLGFVFVWLMIFRNRIAIAYPSVTMSQGLGLRAGVIDGAISISAVQVLLLKLAYHSLSHPVDMILCNVYYMDHS